MHGIRQTFRNLRATLRNGRIVTILAALLTTAATTAADPPPVEFSLVPGDDAQPNGPTYDFRISRFEIRNDQFVEFLNDALGNLTNRRGQYMFFDSTTGDVYVNTSQTGQVYTGSGGRAIKMFSPTTARQIEFVDGSYEVVTTPLDYASHAVTGVTWYGALKYCNWMTLISDLPAEERAYHEGPSSNLSTWRPVTIAAAEWLVRDLTDTERDNLLAKLGFRLPMDSGVDAADPYNEWYKVAAWDPSVNDNRNFGFGRDTITGQDANFRCSGDPFDGAECMDDGGTTPVGYYDGTDHGGTFQTNPLGNQNGYDAFDMSGNVWEWVQDQSPSDPDRRRERGGSWRNFDALLQVTFSADRSASSTDDATGLRVVQSIVNDLIVMPFDELTAAGPWGGPYDNPLSDQITYHLWNVVEEPVSFMVATDAAWVAATPTDGSVQPGETVDVTVSLESACGVDELELGANAAMVTITDGAGQTVAERGVHLTVREPLQLTPISGFASVMPFRGDPSPFNKIYTFSSVSDSYVDWSADWVDTSVPPTGAAWLTISGSDNAAGSVPPQSSWPIIVAIDASAVAAFEIGTYTAEVTFVNECTGTEFVRGVTLTVLTPFSVTPVDAVGSTGVSGGPFSPPFHQLTVSNGLDRDMTWTVEVCSEPPGSGQCTPPPQPSWLSLDTSGGTIGANGGENVTATITADADSLEADGYSLTLRFEEPTSGFLLERVVTLDVTGLRVEPDADTEFTGPLGGPFQPASQVYTLQNFGMPQMSWEAMVAFDPPLGPGEPSWLDVDPMLGVILDENDVDEATVTLTAAATLLSTGTYEATVTFRGDAQPETDTTRLVTLAVGAEAFSVPMVMVPAEDVQPQGPTYTYRIGQNEITNAEFVRFLNRARRNALSSTPDERSQFMYFDIDSGDVYINDQQAGAEGTDAPSATLTTLMFDAEVSGQIAFVGNEFVASTGKEEFPAGGVSWYGALKFCNWMTLTQGMDSTQRAY
ncbi:MAG: SUMF1/EgtB/PvdO family nonheme iron enzyme, partial [Planctomycetota bacterium]